MMGEVIARFGRADASGFFVRGGEFLFADFTAACERSAAAGAAGEPVVVASTAFGWVMLVEWLAGRSLPLPTGSRIMETGGYKGRSAEWSRAELYDRLSVMLNVPPSSIVSEYGMCELSSQFYATETNEGRAIFRGPPWVAVLAIDPETQRPAPAGQRGLLRVIDLANRGSAIAVQTEDEVIIRSECQPAVFELIGRAESAEPKGCSLTAEDLARPEGPQAHSRGRKPPVSPTTPKPQRGDSGIALAPPGLEYCEAENRGLTPPAMRFDPFGVEPCPSNATTVPFFAGDIPALAERLAASARPAGSIDEILSRIEPLAEVARRWLTQGDPIREEALAQLPAKSPFPRAMWREAIDAIFQPVKAASLQRFVREELAGIDPVRFPRLIGQVLAGNVPAPAVQALWVGTLAGSAQLVKPASEDLLFPALLVRSIAAVDGRLAERIGIAHWPGQSGEHNAALARSADAVVVFGRRETIDSWKRTIQLANPAARMIGHGPRTSLEVIELHPADRSGWAELAARVALDVAMYDQQGCLSPQQVYLAGDVASAGEFAQFLGDGLAKRQAEWPSPQREVGQALAIRRAREAHRIRRIIAPNKRRWLSDDATEPADRFGWTLLGSDDSRLAAGPGGRTVFLTRVDSLEEALDAIQPSGDLIQGVAIHSGRGGDSFDRIATALREQMKIPYCCRPGELQRPPFGWRNDNIRPLRSLV
jgi:hypothetical protein